MQSGRLLTAFIAAACATTAFAAPPPPSHPPHADVSWGKAGVSLYDYRLDGAECAWQAMSLDVSGTAAAQTLVRASRELNHIVDTAWMSYSTGTPNAMAVGSPGIAYQQALHKYRTDEQFAAVRDLQYDTLGRCLAERGYSRFQLTAEQRATLKHLRRGSDERRAFLYGLASDREVLQRQAL